MNFRRLLVRLSDDWPRYIWPIGLFCYDYDAVSAFVYVHTMIYPRIRISGVERVHALYCYPTLGKRRVPSHHASSSSESTWMQSGLPSCLLRMFWHRRRACYGMGLDM